MYICRKAVFIVRHIYICSNPSEKLLVVSNSSYPLGRFMIHPKNGPDPAIPYKVWSRPNLHVYLTVETRLKIFFFSITTAYFNVHMHHHNLISTTKIKGITHILKLFTTLFLQFRLLNCTSLCDSETAKQSHNREF